MRILIAEDNRIQLRLLRGLLTVGHEVVVATTESRHGGACGDNPPSLAILDWMMPAMDGLRICRELRKPSERAYTYILLLTAKDRKADLVEAMDAGADDYLTKPFDAQELKSRLLAGKRLLDLQEQLIAGNRKLLFQATHDNLTGLLNRGAILDVLLNEFARSRREKHSVGVLLADIDYFKKINDIYGHAMGDSVLRETAQTIRSTVRTYDPWTLRWRRIPNRPSGCDLKSSEGKPNRFGRPYQLT